MTTKEALHTIIELICLHYATTPLQLKYASRKQPIAEARQAVWLIAHKTLGKAAKQADLGELFNRDRTTVVHGIQSAQNRYDTNKDFSRFVDEAEAEIRRLMK